MTKCSFTLLIPFLLFSFLSCSNQKNDQAPESAGTFDLPASGLEISDAWARPGQPNGVTAIYLSMLNGSTEADTLLSLSTPIAGMAEVHESYKREEGMMGMRPAGEIVIPARDAVTLQPGGLHVMVMQLKEKLETGNELELTLQFAIAGEKTISVPVRTMND